MAKNENRIFKIPVSWEMCGLAEIEASSLEEAVKKFDKIHNDMEYPLPAESDFVDASFHRNKAFQNSTRQDDLDYYALFNK